MEPLLQITWTDPLTGARGYLVIDALVRGLASGGLRMREGCTLEEVRGLARAMTLKEALVFDPADRYRPLGGAKGGVDVDPGDPEAPGILRRFLVAVLPLVREQWNLGEDLGVRQETLDAVVADLGLGSTVEPVFASLDDVPAARRRLAEAFAVEVDGIGLADLVGGYGVARAAVAAARRAGFEPRGARAVVQGFGSIGGATARYLAAAGVRVVAVVDRFGVVRDDAGLDVESLLAARDATGVLDRARLSPATSLADRSTWLDVPCDVLVPAATSFAIGLDDATRVRARLVVEGANLPTLPEAERALFERGVTVVPDVLANVMTNAWWWWVVFGDIEPTSDAAFARIGAVMDRLLDRVWDDAEATGRSPREAAVGLAERNAAALVEADRTVGGDS